MRASTLALATIASLAASGAALAQTAAPMKDMPGMAMAPAAKHGQGTGVIQALDPQGGSITLQHGPIPAVSWPAMTMTFKAKPGVLKGLKVGKTVDFDTTVTGMAGEVTAVRPK
jgi:Cu(I)/Ag(I) efflux system protein CusF